MNNIKTFVTRSLRQRGIALVTVITLLALATGLLLALFSLTQSELKSTVVQTDGASARQQADAAVNIVIGQIQKASQQDTATSGREIWASQPGMVRQYRENGVMLSANKLYSDSEMVIKPASASTGADFQAHQKIVNDLPPTDWDTQKELYVDMNEPIVRVDTGSGLQNVRFPIMDPRAYDPGDATHSVEGFSYSEKVDGVAGGNLSGVVFKGGSENDARLPMPVEWLYVLKDGTLGYLNAQKKFVGAMGETATKDNPIVSRVAFWTDDESSKININTAGEGTFWGTPRVYHEWDRDWAQYQPMMYEYQRYPGHPATVAMSTVLFPGQNMNPYRSDTAAFSKAVDIKEQIYTMMPKLVPGGSKGGTMPVGLDRNFTPTAFTAVQDALRKRLFASVDEFILQAPTSSGGTRQEITLAGASGFWPGVSRPEVVKRLGAFLTANSRASETNPFGYPKIAMWPLHNVAAAQNATTPFRTAFDKTIAQCATLANKAYYFVRADSRSQDELDIVRNSQLHNYMMTFTDNPIPGFGTTSTATFANKYGDNREQILIEIFDYIRSTNLFDENLAETTVGMTAPVAGLPGARTTAYNTVGANAGMTAKTFTPLRNGTGSSFPGHGQVVPSVKPKSNNEVYRGMGRFLTISEVGLHFIATAEGTTDAGGKFAEKLDPPATAGNGFTPMRWKGPVAGQYSWGDNDYWYSNFPPLTPENSTAEEGFYSTKYPLTAGKTTRGREGGIEGNSPQHPGYNPLNWNWTLDANKPLGNGIKRVQANVMLEWFSPSAGWARYNPDVAIEIDASALYVDDWSTDQNMYVKKMLFPVNVGKGPGKVLLRPFNAMSSGWGVYERGGTISYRPFLQGRKLPAVQPGLNGFTKGSMPPDGGTATSNGRYFDTRYNSGKGILEDCNKYQMISDFFDVNVAVRSGKIRLYGGKVKIKLMKNTDSLEILQEFEIEFPGMSDLPPPTLATRSENTTSYQEWNGNWVVRRPVAAPYWWSFHADGALGRTETGLTLTQDGNGNYSNIMNTTNGSWGGRFRFIGDEIGSYGNVPGAGTYNRGNLAIPDDTIHSMVITHGDPRLTMGQYFVPATEFQKHRYWGLQNLAHNIVFAHWSDGPGLDKGEDKLGWRLVTNAKYGSSFVPDHPYTAATGAGLQRYGDFDRATANQTDGAYINKPDEGNFYSTTSGSTGETGIPYFTDPWVAHMGGGTYFSPNRQVASPGMFGSLPTGIHDSGNSPISRRRQPWRTLLFRPQNYDTALNQTAHPGAPASMKGFGGAAGLDAEGVNPPDYLFMDFYWMPVVEPYAVSEIASTSGKINLNYQIAPFRHIKRATALHAAMKSEMITAVAHIDADKYLSRPGGAPTNGGQAWFWKDDSSTSGKKYWHRQIDLDATMKIFDERFSSGFNFISPAQICEMPLLPKRVNTNDVLCPATWPTTMAGVNAPNSGIRKFWADHAITGENLKERPYTNIYSKLTTRSNTYTVHIRAQTLRKARSQDPGTFTDGVDTVASEYRGSTTIERYLDERAIANLPSNQSDFAIGNASAILARPNLEAYHRFRVLNQKRFD